MMTVEIDRADHDESLRLLLVDDHAVVRRGLKELISEQLAYAVTFFEAVNAAETLVILRHTAIDLVLLDISLPDNTGLELLTSIHAEQQGCKILVVSMYSEEQFALRAFQAGADGYLTKDSAPEELSGAIQRIMAGKHYVSPSFSELLLSSTNGLTDGAKPLHSLLSEREWQVARMIASGTPLKCISATLNLSEKTISTYRSRILDKLQISSNAELIRYFIYNRLA